MKNDIAIIGIGSFGTNVAQELLKNGTELLLIDLKESTLNKFGQSTATTAVCDSTNLQTLIDLGITNYDYVVVAIGQDLTASILTTLNLKELGVKNIIVKVSDADHSKIIEKLGVSQTVYPDLEMGSNLATKLLHRTLIDFVDLSESHRIVQVEVKKEKFTDIALSAMKTTSVYNVMIIYIKRNGVMIMPSASEVLQVGDLVFITGAKEDVDKFVKVLS